MGIARTWALLLIAPQLLFMLLFFAAPFALLATTGGGEAGAGYAAVLGDPYYWGVFWYTLEISATVTFACLLVAYPIAYLLVRVVRRRTLKRLMFIIVIAPLFTSNIVRSFGWIVLLGRNGAVNDFLVSAGIVERPVALLYTDFSVILGLVYVMVPFMILTIASALQNIDRALGEAARDLGAGAFTSFLKVTLPLSLPGIVAGSLIVFTLTMGAYVTPSVMSGGKSTVMSMLIYQQYGVAMNYPLGAVLAVTLLVGSLFVVGVYLLVMSKVESRFRPMEAARVA